MDEAGTAQALVCAVAHGTLVVCEIDLQVGDTWHYVMRRDDGTEMEMRGYREIAPPERLVSTESYDDP